MSTLTARRPRLLGLFCGAGGCSMGYHRAGFDLVGVDNRLQKRYPFQFVQADALEYLAECGHCYDAIHASPPCQAYSALKHLAKKDHPELIEETRRLLKATGKPYVIENVVGAPLQACLILCGTMFGLRTDCGAELRRHRLFETNWFAGMVPPCQHGAEVISVVGKMAENPKGANHGRPRVIGVYGGTPYDPAIYRAESRLAKRPVITATGHTPVENVGRNRVITVAGSTPQQNVVDNVVRETFSVEQARNAMGIDWMIMKELSQAIPPAYTEFIGRHLIEYLETAR